MIPLPEPASIIRNGSEVIFVRVKTSYHKKSTSWSPYIELLVDILFCTREKTQISVYKIKTSMIAITTTSSEVNTRLES